MSMLRQLLLSVTIAIGVILLGTLALSVNAAREYLSGQLQVQSTDASVSLALSLSQPANNDPVLQELLVSALFDGGHFSLVRLSDPEGKVLIERRSTATAASVPGWFRTLAPLASGTASHAVSDGWRQIGEVTLVANDAYAWEALWRSSLKMVALVVGAGVLWALFAFALVRWIKNRLLREISEHVRSIGQTPPQQVEARVPELSGVVQALNQTRERVYASVEEQNAQIESLKLELNQDPVTGLPNRKYFVNEFRRALEASAPTDSGRGGETGGHVLVLRQRDLADLNRHMPREFIDQWLRAVCERVQASLASLNAGSALLARLNGSDFALLLPRCASHDDRRARAHRPARLAHPVGEGHLCRWAQAMTDYSAGSQAGPVLSRLDFGLMRAESAGNDQVVILGATDTQSPSEAGEQAGSRPSSRRWRKPLRVGHRDTDQRQRQPGADRGHADAAHRRGPDAHPATLFIPPAVRLDLVADCDLQAVALGLQWLAANEGELAVRVALPSLRGQKFFRQLALLLTESARWRPGCSWKSMLTAWSNATSRSPRWRGWCRNGAHIGVRRLAQQFGAVAQLRAAAVLREAGRRLRGRHVAKPGQPAADGLGTADGARPEHRGVCGRRADAETQRILAGLGINVMRGPGVRPQGRQG